MEVPLSKKLSFLLCAVLLFGCGAGGGGDGGDETNGSTPIVSTLPASSITPTNAILNGAVNPNALQTQSWFEYGTNSALATYTSSTKQDEGSWISKQTSNMTWNGLVAGTIYYFRFCAENSKGYSKGQIVSFATSSPGDPPTVSTLSATSVGATGATLNGNVTANGLATDAWFEWGTDSTLSTSTSTSSQSTGSGITNVSVNAALTGLTTGTKYYYRVVANNTSGSTRGNILSFTTTSSSLPSKTVYWAPPQSFTDGTPLDPSRDLQGYEIYVKQDSSFEPADNPVATPSPLDISFYLGNIAPPLTPGVTYYVSIRTVTVDGMKSGFSPPYPFSP
jgi:hypothetical protein